jgi:ParB/RepB/Spo0J family partition protein
LSRLTEVNKVPRTVTPLQEIPVGSIKPNPENPRLIFREEEMSELLESIREVGIKVPVSVYADRNKFVLLDGERRWRCAKRLNLRTVPAITQPKPSKLENLLMMFNIHNVRVDWDIMPMAIKLNDIRELLAKEGKPTNPKSLAGITGVRLATVRRALELLDLPVKYRRMLLREAEKPRGEQRIKADLFIEVYKSLHTVERYVPEVFESVERADYVDSMVAKYVDRVVDNVVGFRELGKIARAEQTNVERVHAIGAVVRLVREPSYSVEDAYKDTVQAAYEQRDIVTRVRTIVKKVEALKGGVLFNSEVRSALEQLRNEINRLLDEHK